jgi:hypothetical protein
LATFEGIDEGGFSEISERIRHGGGGGARGDLKGRRRQVQDLVCGRSEEEIKRRE